MKWYGLFTKIGNQNMHKMKIEDVVVLIDDKEIPLELKFKVNGSPYLVPKTIDKNSLN